MAGPLSGMRVVEIAGMGPGPFCAMLLADMGAEVIRVHRPGSEAQQAQASPTVGRGMCSVSLDLKSPKGRDIALRLVEKSDALIEGFRPGVMERLGLGPDVCLERNPALVYGRMTGWGQHGPLAMTAGHDINYIAVTGALAAIGSREAGPTVPLNLIGDFGGGGMLLAFGLVCGMLEAGRSGKGQVVDAAMTEGASLLMATTFGQYGAGRWKLERHANLLDGGAHFYSTYRCADDKWVAVGAIEPQFYAALMQGLGLDRARFEPQHDRSRWPAWKARLAEVFASRTRDEWVAIMEGSDACVSPVLDMAEALEHPHNQARQTFIEVDGIRQPAPAPRFSRTVARVGERRAVTVESLLSKLGLHEDEIAALI